MARKQHTDEADAANDPAAVSEHASNRLTQEKGIESFTVAMLLETICNQLVMLPVGLAVW